MDRDDENREAEVGAERQQDGGGEAAVVAVPDEGIIDGNDLENVDNNEDIDMPYRNWAIRPADEPLPDNVIHVMGQVFQNDMVSHILIEYQLSNLLPYFLITKQTFVCLACGKHPGKDNLGKRSCIN